MIADLYANYALWVWLALGGVLLATELVTGSGWLLWPAACAGVLALFTLTGIQIGPVGEIALFSVLTIATSILARRFTPSWSKPDGKDINDRTGDLVGLTGEAVSLFAGGYGRVMVDGTEWAAELDGAGDVGPGSKIKVLRVIDGAKLKVRAV